MVIENLNEWQLALQNIEQSSLLLLADVKSLKDKIKLFYNAVIGKDLHVYIR